MLDFLHGDNRQGNLAFETTTFCLGHSSFLSSHIPGFFDHQYLWKESIDILVFSMELRALPRNFGKMML